MIGFEAKAIQIEIATIATSPTPTILFAFDICPRSSDRLQPASWAVNLFGDRTSGRPISSRSIEDDLKEEEMKRVAIAICLAIMAFTVAAPAQTPAGKEAGTEEQALLALMQDWMNAEVKADMAFLDGFIAEDCVI